MKMKDLCPCLFLRYSVRFILCLGCLRRGGINNMGTNSVRFVFISLVFMQLLDSVLTFCYSKSTHRNGSSFSFPYVCCILILSSYSRFLSFETLPYLLY